MKTKFYILITGPKYSIKYTAIDKPHVAMINGKVTLRFINAETDDTTLIILADCDRLEIRNSGKQVVEVF